MQSDEARALCYECLNVHWFNLLDEAKAMSRIGESTTMRSDLTWLATVCIRVKDLRESTNRRVVEN